MNQFLCATLLLGSGVCAISAQAPARVDYVLRVDTTDFTSISVEMRVIGAPRDFRIAMSTHSEYDDQYWRYLTDASATSERGAVRVTRQDSSVWRVTGPAGNVTIRYRVHYPALPVMQQPAWKAHLSREGGLIGGPHSFLYVVGGERAPVRVSLVLPSDWKIATGLAPAAGIGAFAAPNAEALIDSPMLVGRFRSWEFAVNGVPHRIAYLGHTGGVPFDSALLVSNVERLTRATVQMFGAMPYRQFQFIFEDGASGGLEHTNSVNIGMRSADLARDPNSVLGQLAHEFFHTWNEVHLRPASWIGLRHVMPKPTGELWWAEGVTLYYADLLLRRAGLPVFDSTRLSRLERQIAMYNANPSHGMVSLEATSRQFNLSPALLGDHTPSMYTQGEVVGAALDMIVRAESRGTKSLDDVMRSLSRQFSVARGYTGVDIERAVRIACSCNIKPFFDKYVRTANPVDFNHALALFGLRSVVSWSPARGADGTALPDLRVSAFRPVGEEQAWLQVWFPATVWGRAGLHTGDRLLSLNGQAVTETQQVRAAIAALRIGDTVRVEGLRATGLFETTVRVTGYDRPVARIEELPAATAAQRALRAKWMAGQ